MAASYNHTKCLLNFDNFPFVDSSPSSHTITNSNVTITDTNAWSVSAGRFEQASSALLTMGDSTDWDWGTDNWTVDWRMYIHSFNNDDGIWGSLDNTLNKGINCAFGTSAQGTIIRILTNGAYRITTVGESVPLLTPVHMAVVRDDTFIKVYRDGNLMVGGSWAHGGLDINTPDTGFQIGRFYTNTAGFHSDVTIDEFRITKGRALWTSNFTPPSAPYTIAPSAGSYDFTIYSEHIDENLSWFPATLALSGSTYEDFLDSVDSSVDKNFTVEDASGNKLYTEIENMDFGSQATFHTAVTTIPSDSNTTLTLNWDWADRDYSIRALSSGDYLDDFSGNLSKWKNVGTTTSIQSNKLNMPLGSGQPNSDTQAWFIHEDLVGNFDVQVDFDLVTYPNSSFWGAQLVVEDTDGEGCSLVRGWYGKQEYRTWENGAGWQGSILTTDVSGKLRVTRVGTTWTAYTWNGSSWDTNHTWNPGTAADIDTIYLTLQHGDTQPACEVNWDNFQFNHAVYDQTEVGDTFTGTNGDSPDEMKWTIITGSPTIQSNKLKFTPSGITEQIRTKYQFDDDFDVQMDWDVISLDTNGEIGIRAWQNNSNYLRVHYKDVSGTKRYQANKMEGGGYSVLGNNIRTDDPGKLRIRRVGSVFTTYGYWSNGWQQIHSATHSYLDGPLNIEIQCYEQAATTTEIDVDNFQVNSADSITGWTDDTNNLPAQTVWDSNYKIVTHLADTPTGAADDILDSTGNELHGTSYNMGAGNSGTNEFGKFLSFDGTEEWIDFGDAFYANAGTIEAIINVTNYSNSDVRVIVLKRNTAGTATASDDEVEFYSLATHRPWIGAWDAAAGLTVSKAGIAGADTTGTEVYVAGAYDSGGGSDISAQQNDVINTGPNRNATAIDNTTSAWQIAARSNNDNDRWFLGNIREVRISNIYRSEAWRLATWRSLMGTLYSESTQTLTVQDMNIITSSDDITTMSLSMAIQNMNISTSADAMNLIKQLEINNLNIHSVLRQMNWPESELSSINTTVDARKLLRAIASLTPGRTVTTKIIKRILKQIQ
jgi:hypothetical protein